MTTREGSDGRNGRKLEGAAAIVTGASSGIGWATAKALVSAGARLGLAARRAQPLEDLKRQLEADDGAAVVLPTDVRDREQVVRMVDRTHETFGRLDILVNNAGIGYWSPEGIVEGVLDQWRAELDVNLMGLMTGTHAAARIMHEQGSGHIVNVSSLAGRYAAGQIPGYATSKFGVNGFTESARRDLRRHGIRVTLIEPGEVATPIQPEEDLARMKMLNPEDVADAILYAVTRPPHVCISDIQLVLNPDA